MNSLSKSIIVMAMEVHILVTTIDTHVVHYCIKFTNQFLFCCLDCLFIVLHLLLSVMQSWV